jgi:hypothetical protein
LWTPIQTLVKAGIADALPMAMMHKQHAMPMFQPVTQTGPAKSHLREFVAYLMRSVEIPTAYQDENGFHTGAEPVKTEIQWPPA